MHYLYLLILLCISAEVNASCIQPSDINTIENFSKGWQQGDAATPLVESIKNTISEVKKCTDSSITATDLYYLAEAYAALGALRQLELVQAKVSWKDIYIDENFLKVHKKQEEYYKQVILTDNREPFELSLDQYRDMVGGLPDELKVIAYSRMLKTPFYGETDDIRTGDYFQYSNAYFRMGEYDKAIEVLNQMMAEKKAGNSDISVPSEYIQSRIQEVENKKLEMAQASQHDQYSQVSEPIAEPYATAEEPKPASKVKASKQVEKPAKAAEPKQAEAPKATKETPADNTMLWWLLGGGVGLLGLIGLLLRRKKG